MNNKTAKIVGSVLAIIGLLGIMALWLFKDYIPGGLAALGVAACVYSGMVGSFVLIRSEWER